MALVGSRGRDVQFRLALGAGEEEVEVDRIQIQQVRSIYSQCHRCDGGIAEAEVAVETLVDDGEVQVLVSDIGCGVDGKIADRLFEAFITTKESGMGVGLSICKEIVEAHGGKIGFRRTSREERRSISRSRSPGLMRIPKRGRMVEPALIHIVDDDADIRESLQVLLSSAGYRCATYASGDAFLSAAPKASVACAIVDVRMPGMDGLALMDELRERKIQIPVILATGFGDVPLAVRAMKAGAIDFIEKPCRLPDLQNAVARALAIAEKGRKDATKERRRRAASPA